MMTAIVLRLIDCAWKPICFFLISTITHACAAGRPALLAVPGDKPVLGRRVTGWRQNLHRTHGVTFGQRQRHYREECGVRNGEAGGGADRQILWSTYGIPMEYLWNTYGVPMEYLWSTYGIPMEYLWNSYGTTRLQHACNTPAAGGVLAGSARTAQFPCYLVTRTPVLPY